MANMVRIVANNSHLSHQNISSSIAVANTDVGVQSTTLMQHGRTYLLGRGLELGIIFVGRVLVACEALEMLFSELMTFKIFA